MKILKPHLSVQGYLQIQLTKSAKRKYSSVHRLVAELFILNTDNKPEVNHRDGVKLNNHVSNLEWVTSSENKQSALKIGLRPSGSDHPQAKLAPDQVVYVRNNPDGLTVTQLAEMFDTKATVISKVQLGDCYKNADGIIREKIWCRISDDVRGQIRADYQNGVRGCGYRVLAKKYGVAPMTIKKIVNEK